MLPVDYSFYKDIFGGTEIPSKKFNRYAHLAVRFIKSMAVYSPDLSKDYDYKMAVCHAAEQFMRYDLSYGISREDNDGYSISYDKKEYRKIISDTISVYLADKGVLYCGMGVTE